MLAPEFHVTRHGSESFRRTALPWLMRREAEHSLLLGIVAELGGTDHRYEGAPYLATVERQGEVVGCAFRTPPYKLGLTRMPAEAAPLLAADVGEVFEALPAVMGPPVVAMEFGTRWCETRACRPLPVMRLGIFELTEVAPMARSAAGGLRGARGDELPLLTRWCAEFAAESATPVGDPARTTAHFVGRGEMFVWEDGGPMSMAVATGPTPTGMRVGLVYTPPERRGHGYATALVADLSAAQLAAGRRACFLYTDLANPTSNRIYERIGYRRVAEALDVEFRPARP